MPSQVIKTLVGASACALATACATAPIQDPVAAQTYQPATPAAHFEQDRAAILAMAGDYHVRFQFQETVPLLAGYELADEKLSGGYEVVRVIEDDGEFISLQHILVVGPADAPIVVKHWRQDWMYEPSHVLVFIGGNAWETHEIPAALSQGSWSQTVYQVDDAPRYGAVGQWSHEDGISQWTPPAEWRPLPRRDMTTRDDYHTVDAINQHTITPFGWVHEQNNTKLILGHGDSIALVREIGVNTYAHSDEFDPTPALEYWDATSDYWALIRAEWARIAAENESFAITVPGETDELYGPLLTIAEDVVSGAMTAEDGFEEARSIMAEYVTSDFGALPTRLRETDTLLD